MKTKTTHTPGPWRVGENLLCDDVVYSPNGTIAEIFKGRMAHEIRANARLIAAAPMLLKRLKELAAWVAEQTPDYPAELVAALVEIDKVERGD